MNSADRSFNFWPYGIATVLVLFAGGVACLAFLALRHPPELVSRDYYEQELRYQDQIDRRARTAGLSTKLQIRTDTPSGRIHVVFPPDHARLGISGTLRLYRPSDAGLDRAIPLAPDALGIQSVETAVLAPGLWHLRVEWSSAGKDYTAAEKVRVPDRRP
jgi:hypothetical protein